MISRSRVITHDLNPNVISAFDLTISSPRRHKRAIAQRSYAACLQTRCHQVEPSAPLPHPTIQRRPSKRLGHICRSSRELEHQVLCGLRRRWSRELEQWEETYKDKSQISTVGVMVEDCQGRSQACGAVYTQMESTNLFGATSRGGETYNLLDVARLGSRL